MIELKNIHKYYNPGSVNELCLFQKFSLEIPDGDFVAVVGSNGSGKTSLLNIICGTIPIDSGDIIVNGTSIVGKKDFLRHRSIGRVYQDPSKGTCPSMTILENLSLADNKGKPYNLGKGINKAKIEQYKELLKKLNLGLEDKLYTQVGSLSGGQRQAITLLMASIQKPKLLLLDEHTAALDPKTAAKVLEISDQIISENHLTAMMVTHNMKDAIAHGNRLIMMHEGKVILNIAGEDKKKLTVGDLLHQCEKVSGEEFASDKALLS